MADLESTAWNALTDALMEFDGRPVGVRASRDQRLPTLNYDQCFVRDFALCAPAFLLRDRSDVVREFLLSTLRLQSRKRGLGALQPRIGLMPGSFRPVRKNGDWVLEGDYGEESIARVTPADSVFWWILTLRAYVLMTGDEELAARDDVQHGLRLILGLVLEGSFEMFPTLLVPDGSFMIDRRMGVYGHPLEVQALFFAALRAARELLAGDDDWRDQVQHRLQNLRHHVGRYYWLDHDNLRELAQVGSDEYGEDASNVFNVFPESIPSWVEEWIPDDAGYFAGNVGPGRIDFRFFTQGNLLTLAAGLADDDKSTRLMQLMEARWDDLVGTAPLRIVFPALTGESWKVITGADAKNEPWRYHNGGSWPCLLWSFATATSGCDRLDLLERAVSAVEARLEDDAWPEYYDGRTDPKPGKRARCRQSWTMGSYLYAKACLRDPSVGKLYSWPDEIRPEEAVSARVSAGD
ncbi:MAG: glycoside hydrolase 100 family protein [Gemmatimonadota bacterium]|jgi:glycogen debranching enzyme